jgi:WD40 repeat protein
LYVTALCKFSKGFIICSNKGDMAMWVRSEDNNSTSGKQPYDFIRRWSPQCTKNLQISGTSVSVNEENVVVSLVNNNIGIVNLKSVGLNEDTEREIKFDLLCRGFHSKGIDSMDVAVQRPILVTASRDDSTIRIWNYLTGVCELAREYYVLEDAAIRAQAKPLVSVALHPSGYQLAITFIDKVAIHHILNDDLLQTNQIETRGVYFSKYSSGGQYFFAVERSNLFVYNAYTFVKIQTLRVDTQKVLNIVFSQYDRAFAVLGADGWIGRYALPSFKMILKATLPDAKLDKWKSYRDIVFLPDTKEAQKNDGEMQLCVVGTDGELQRLKIVNQQNKVIRH